MRYAIYERVAGDAASEPVHLPAARPPVSTIQASSRSRQFFDFSGSAFNRTHVTHFTDELIRGKRVIV